MAAVRAIEGAGAGGADPVLVGARRGAGDGDAAAAAEDPDLAPGERREDRRVVALSRRGVQREEEQGDGGERQRANGHGVRPPGGGYKSHPHKHGKAEPRKGAVQSLGIAIPGISIGFSAMDDFASAPRPVSARSPCFPCVLTTPNGTSREAHNSPPSPVVTCSARNVPAGTVTDSQPTTCAPLHFPAQSNAEAFGPACLPIIPAISPEIRMAGCAPALKTSARGASNPNARLVVRICTTPLLLGSFPAKLTSNQYSVESPDRSDPTTARRNFPTPALPVPSNEAH